MRNFWWLGWLGLSSAFPCSCSRPAPRAESPQTIVETPPAPSSAAPAPNNAAPASSRGLPAPSLLPEDVSAPLPSAATPAAGAQCDEHQYCAFPPEARCGAGDMAGRCKPMPSICTMEFAPVCGCNGRTYGSACMAAGKGISVASRGACPTTADSGIPEGGACGTRGVADTCKSELYCAFASHCGAADAGGVCRKKPEICNNLFVAVCGCDGETYPNACHAERAGVSVAASGACPAK